jgi:hypothetical protein
MSDISANDFDLELDFNIDPPDQLNSISFN